MRDDTGRTSARTLAFGPFELIPGQEILLENGRPLRLGSRALAILAVLAGRAGELVSKEELFRQVWAHTFVDEANLRVHIGALRKVLGDGQSGRRYIVNVPGRGYRFTAAVTERDGVPAPTRLPLRPADEPAPMPPRVQLPAPLARMVGREPTARALCEAIGHRRLVTIVGPGGVGKTTVAVAVAESIAGDYADGARFVDLAPVSDPRLVASALAATLGQSIPLAAPLPALVAALQDRRMLVLLDNCEHVVEAAATLAEALLRGAPHLRILATSREPLRAEGEWIHRLASLAAPAPHDRPGAAAALEFAAVQLFVERAVAGHDAFELTDADAPTVAELCRRLDGLPLAIEFAASRIGPLGVHGLAAQLDDRFRMLARGRRTALPRQQTLRATLDWSYDLLSDIEQRVLQRLSLFRSRFTMDAAVAVAGDMDPGDVMDGVTGLAAKSLVVVDASGDTVRYRLLDTTRVYARDRLADGGQTDRAKARHARHCLAHFGRARADWDAMATEAWVETYAGWLDDVRAALDWAAAPGGDSGLGRALTAVAAPLWFQLSLLEEYEHRAASALAADDPLDPDMEMQLLEALGHALWHATDRMADTFGRMLAIAIRRCDAARQLGAHWGLWLSTTTTDDHAASLRHAERYRALAAQVANPHAHFVSDRMMALSLHFAGDQSLARPYAESAFRHPLFTTRTAFHGGFHFDERVATRNVLARILAVSGAYDRAWQLACDSVEVALSMDHDISLCYTLATGACPIALWRGDDEEAERLVDLLLERSTRSSAHFWRSWGEGLRAALLWRRSGRRSLLPLPAANPASSQMSYFVTTCEALADRRMVERALAGETGWSTAEILRGHALGCLDQDAAGAEALCRRAAGVARRQGALAWELRAATSLADILQRAGRRGDAMGELAPVYARLTEGFGCADARRARLLLEELQR